MHLRDLSIGEKARIIGYSPCDRHYRRKLLVMGLTPGTEVTLIGIAPLGDPVEISSRGHCLCLRKSEAHVLKLEKLL
ncbi:MAG: ferrous iron transport protein A [Gammaproteobacteria bacterium]|nr:ferrous iron transport protein A [Gammaproteobacteria bacterium]